MTSVTDTPPAHETPVDSPISSAAVPTTERETPTTAHIRFMNLDRLVEFAVAIMLAVVAVATAWSGYQASRWGGLMSIDFSQASAARVESGIASDLADEQRGIDADVYAAWANAYATKDTELATFYESRMRPEFAVAFEAWKALEPMENLDAPLTPFEMDEYHQAAEDEASRLLGIAEEKSADALNANQQSDDYVFTSVLFATVLFFAAMIQRFQFRNVRLFMAVLGLVLMLWALGRLAVFPKY